MALNPYSFVDISAVHIVSQDNFWGKSEFDFYSNNSHLLNVSSKIPNLRATSEEALKRVQVLA